MGTVKVIFDSPVQVHVRDAQGNATNFLREVAPGEPVEMDEEEAKSRIEQGNVRPFAEAAPPAPPRRSASSPTATPDEAPA